MKHTESMARRTFLRKAAGAVLGLVTRIPLVLPEAEAVEAEAVEAEAVSWSTLWHDGGWQVNAGTAGNVTFHATSGGEWLHVATAP